MAKGGGEMIQEIQAIYLVCALAQPPWNFINPLSVKAKINSLADLAKLDDLYPQYDWEFIEEETSPKKNGWIPTPWVFGQWRIYAKRKIEQSS